MIDGSTPEFSGYLACKQGLHLSDNPFKLDRIANEEWNKGFTEFEAFCLGLESRANKISVLDNPYDPCEETALWGLWGHGFNLLTFASKDPQADSYKAGQYAYLDGGTLQDNPHDPTLDLHYHWKNGFKKYDSDGGDDDGSIKLWQ